MRTLIIITLFSFFAFNTNAGEGNTSSYNEKHGELNINIEGLTSLDGNVKVLLFHQEEGFPFVEQNAMYAVDANVVKKRKTVVFKSIPFGEYAIYVYHDKNKNGKMDKNFIGTPKEDFGYSNMEKENRVKPLFSESLFAFEKNGKEVVINIVPVK